MEAKNVQHPRGPLGAVSRRSVLKSAVVLAASRRARAAKGVVLAYVGTYTPNGQGIHRFQVDLSTGALTQPKIFPSTTNPSWIAFDPTHNFLYAGNEIGKSFSRRSSTASASSCASTPPTLPGTRPGPSKQSVRFSNAKESPRRPLRSIPPAPIWSRASRAGEPSAPSSLWAIRTS